MKVFSKKKFMEERKVSACDQKLVNQCDGKTPAECFPYAISDDWCVDVPDDMREKAREFVEKLLCDVAKLLRVIETQDVNCRCSDVSMHPRYKIVIEGYESTTLATMYVDDKVIKRTAAKRHPADKFNWKIGAHTAFNRLWEKKKKPVKPMNKYAQLVEEKLTEWANEEAKRIFRRFDSLPPVVREVKRLAKPGEWVKIVKKSSEENEDYKIGDVLQIVHSTNGLTGHAYYKDRRSKFLYEYEYVVLEGYKPE